MEPFILSAWGIFWLIELVIALSLGWSIVEGDEIGILFVAFLLVPIADFERLTQELRWAYVMSIILTVVLGFLIARRKYKNNNLWYLPG